MTKGKSELGETIEMANSVLSFYENMIEVLTLKNRLLQAENERVNELLLESKNILKDVLKTPKCSVIN